ncbi:MAG: hypothetical protein KatS3mg023_3597 [Armatimonadota bacterium]|jgi:hypothetical protein|nr:MAG: hypothetical protein KatS3mg023_3597 [Armatimonadota bacterium]
MQELRFDYFRQLEYTGSLDVEAVVVRVDDRLRQLIENAQRFLQENRKASHVSVPLNDDDYEVEFPESPDPDYYPAMVVMNIYRGYLIMELYDEYSMMESDLVYLRE